MVGGEWYVLAELGLAGLDTSIPAIDGYMLL